MDTYTTKDGIKIGIVSASQLSADETHANYIRDGIAELREEGADLVIACCHWGIEGIIIRMIISRSWHTR